MTTADKVLEEIVYAYFVQTWAQTTGRWMRVGNLGNFGRGRLLR
jgi:hypothetical protein